MIRTIVRWGSMLRDTFWGVPIIRAIVRCYVKGLGFTVGTFIVGPIFFLKVI